MRRGSNNNIWNRGIWHSGVWNAKSMGAIALFGILLALSDTKQVFKQAGQSIALFSGGAAVTMLLRKSEDASETHQLRRELQTAHEQQISDLSIAEAQRQQILNHLYVSAIAETTLLTSMTHADETAQAAIAQAEAKIAELEAAIAKKTDLATEMLTELETEATNTFNRFNAKIAAQEALISHLQQQVESLSTANVALSAKKANESFANKSFANESFKELSAEVGKGHPLLNQLVKTR